MKIASNPCVQFLFVILETLAEAAGEAFVIAEAVDFIKGRNTSEDDRMLITWIGFGMAALATIPLAITMVYHWAEGDAHEAEESEDEADETTPQRLIADTPAPHQHSHSIVEECGEFAIIGGPFGLLAVGGSYALLSRMATSQHLKLALCSMAGLLSAWGNYQLHSHHAHAKQGYCELLSKIPTDKKAKAIAFSGSVLLGHLCQGFLDADVFFKGIHETNKLIQYSVSGVLALLVTVFEGRTEMRSTLLHELASVGYRNNSGIAKITLLPAAMVHGLLPSVGAINLTEFIYNLFTRRVMAKDITLAWRITVAATSVLLLGYPNSKGFYCTTLPAIDKAGAKLASTIIECHASLFKTKLVQMSPRRSLQVLIDHAEEVATPVAISIPADPQAQPQYFSAVHNKNYQSFSPH